MSDTAICVEHLSKVYRIGRSAAGYRTLRDTITNLASAPARVLRLAFQPPEAATTGAATTVWALKDVSFRVRHGEVVGIIGRNGAGKSTLLKVLSRITEPTEGKAEVVGRVGSLLEVGTGFHPELTGRENIYLNGAILGMRRAEITRKFGEIVAFAEIERFLDTAVKHYSSGMYLRLAFAVAAHLDPEILVVDEILAVGDLAFQRKCLGKMGEVAREGRTVLLVSHNLAAVESLCNKSLLLAGGRLVFAGGVDGAIQRYLAATGESSSVPIAARRDRTGSGVLRFTSIEVEGGIGAGRGSGIATGSTVRIHLALGLEDGAAPSPGMIDVAIKVKDAKGQLVATLANFFTGECLVPQFSEGCWRLSCTIKSLPLLEGDYIVDLWCAKGPELVDLVTEACRLRVCAAQSVDGGDARRPVSHKHGCTYIDHRWARGSGGHRVEAAAAAR